MHTLAGAVSALCNPLAGLEPSWSVSVVMTAASIGAAKGGGYARYLESKTVEPEFRVMSAAQLAEHSYRSVTLGFLDRHAPTAYNLNDLAQAVERAHASSKRG
jgi:hypothetical protein